MKTPPQPSVTSPSDIPPGLRRFLYLAAGVAGAAVMVVEILGARMLAPYVGTSHFVWTAQIAVTLAALACGYYAGGRMADRGAPLAVLFWSILGAAVFLSGTVALRESAIQGLLSLPLAAASLLASALLFFIPLGLLAMTGPFLVRVLSRSIGGVGGTAGRLSALSTVGSFLGTAAIGYVLIPLLPNSTTMFGTAGALAVVSGCYFLGWGRRRPALLVVPLLVAAGVAAGAGGLRAEGLRIPAMTELFRGNSSFGVLQVVQEKGSPFRFSLDDYLIQNTYDVDQNKSASMFTYMLEGLARAYTARLDDVLCIGMGVGIVPRELAEQGSRVDVVEINPAIVPVARKYFDLDTDSFSLTIGDGRTFLRRAERTYDAVVLDAFLGDSVPTHLMSREAFLAVRNVLKPDGVLVINTFVDLAVPAGFFGASLSRTLLSVFPSVRIHGSHTANTLFVASPRAGLSFVREPDLSGVHRSAVAEVREAYARLWTPDPSAGIVLTDDYNPLEYFDAANRETHRRMIALTMLGR